MAYRNYSSADGLLILNTINITDWGETEPALVIEDVNPRAALKYGLGGGAAKLKPVTRRKRVTVNLLTGSDQARWLIGVMKSDILIQGTWTQAGTVESEVFVDGTVMQRGPRGRIAEQAANLSDEQFVIEFRDSTET